MSTEPGLQDKPQINEPLPESRFAESISIVFFFLKVKLSEIIYKSLHADKIILENR